MPLLAQHREQECGDAAVDTAEIQLAGHAAADMIRPRAGNETLLGGLRQRVCGHTRGRNQARMQAASGPFQMGHRRGL